jgi:hypothetical protein
MRSADDDRGDPPSSAITVCRRPKYVSQCAKCLTVPEEPGLRSTAFSARSPLASGVALRAPASPHFPSLLQQLCDASTLRPAREVG